MHYTAKPWIMLGDDAIKDKTGLSYLCIKITSIMIVKWELFFITDYIPHIHNDNGGHIKLWIYQERRYASRIIYICRIILKTFLESYIGKLPCVCLLHKWSYDCWNLNKNLVGNTSLKY